MPAKPLKEWDSHVRIRNALNLTADELGYLIACGRVKTRPITNQTASFGILGRVQVCVADVKKAIEEEE